MTDFDKALLLMMLGSTMTLISMQPIAWILWAVIFAVFVLRFGWLLLVAK